MAFLRGSRSAPASPMSGVVWHFLALPGVASKSCRPRWSNRPSALLIAPCTSGVQSLRATSRALCTIKVVCCRPDVRSADRLVKPAWAQTRGGLGYEDHVEEAEALGGGGRCVRCPARHTHTHIHTRPVQTIAYTRTSSHSMTVMSADKVGDDSTWHPHT